MSWWEFTACVDGYNRANGADEVLEPMTAQEFDEMIANSALMKISSTVH